MWQFIDTDIRPTEDGIHEYNREQRVVDALNRIIDRAIPVQGAHADSTDTPPAQMAIQARWQHQGGNRKPSAVSATP